MVGGVIVEGYVGLFLSAFLAATFLPVASEVVIAAMAASGAYAYAGLFAVATVGNVLGSTVNWVLGRYLQHFQDRRWFPVKAAAMERASRFFNRWGVWSLLLAWTPFLGDPLCFVAGVLRVPIGTFLVLVTLSKAGRYAALLWVTDGVTG